MRLVRIDEETELPVFNPEARVIKEFRRIIERDKGSKGDHDGRKKKRALLELAFIHYMCVYDSRYNMFHVESERVEKIATDLGLPEGFKIDSDIKLAIDRYKDLMETPAKSLYRKAIKGIEKVEDFIDAVNLNEKNSSGSYVFGPKQLQDTVKGIPDTIKALEEVEKLVRKEEDNKFRKDGNRGQFESSNQDVDKGQIF